ncbi:MAG TPA: hypothetical protein VLY87_05445 [Flavobacterium sp.]|nr:hypothetical protein [Flavobacterium sp.]
MSNHNRNKNNPTQARPSALEYNGQQHKAVTDRWKAEHGSVYAIKTEKKDIFYVRSPKIQEIEAYQPLLQESKFITYNIGLFKTCYLGGAPIPTDEATLKSIAGQMMKTVEVVVAEVEKL